MAVIEAITPSGRLSNIDEITLIRDMFFCILDNPCSYRLRLTESLIKLKAVKSGFQIISKGEFL